MTPAFFYNKRYLCYTNTGDFTDIQGIGNDPIYKRFDSVNSVLKNNINEKYRSFLARPNYVDGKIYWYIDEWKEEPVSLNNLQGEKRLKYEQIKQETIQHYEDALAKSKGDSQIILAAALKFVHDPQTDDFLFCYDNKVSLVAWGMCRDENKHTVHGEWITDLQTKKTCKITFDAGGNGQIKKLSPHVINREKGYKLSQKDLPVVIPNEGYEFIGWDPEPKGCEVQEDSRFVAKYKPHKIKNEPHNSENVRVNFDTCGHGTIEGAEDFTIIKGKSLNPEDIPMVTANQGYKFTGWVPDVNMPINQDTCFVAQYESETICCRFEAGENGTLQGSPRCKILRGTKLSDTQIPKIVPKKGYTFIGWNMPLFNIQQKDVVFTAQYRKESWYSRLWLWLTAKGCLKWLLALIIFLLILFLLCLLFRSCEGCTREETDIDGNPVLPVDTVAPVPQKEGADGKERDDNGTVRDIVGDDGKLPGETVIPPVVDDDGELPPVDRDDDGAEVIANRLLVFFEEANADLNKWAEEFKKIYPGEEYKIIGKEPTVPFLIIQIPESERVQIREALPNRISDLSFFVVDESILNLRGKKSPGDDVFLRGWHLKATNVEKAWQITKGDPEVVVAVVDDGIEADHPLFNGRFYKGYNVYRGNRTLAVGAHGTHVAGLAAGSDCALAQGVAGVAPNCKIMPVQVLDNGVCPFSALISGIIYAVHNGADVVNISIGPSIPGLSSYPVDEQIDFARKSLKNEERVYQHVFKIAAEENAILVFAAGNDNIVTCVLPECRSDNSVNVAAVTPELKASSFTNYEMGTNISAPGVSIYSSVPEKAYTMMDGTSMAAPIVTGAIALMKSVKRDITVRQAIGVLQKSGKGVGALIPPMLQIDKALECVQLGDIPDGPTWTPGDGGENEEGDGGNAGGDGKNIGGDADDVGEIVDNDGNNDAALRKMLEDLIKQRDNLNKQIDELKKRLNI